MANVIDVAEYILAKSGPMSAWKLQKLVYYSQAWNLVWEDRPLFSAKIEAWANGPVVRKLYDKHSGLFQVKTVGGDPKRLSDTSKENIKIVLKHYAGKSPQQLSDLTHMERPWRAARRGVPDGERCNNEITLDSMAEYYGSL